MNDEDDHGGIPKAEETVLNYRSIPDDPMTLYSNEMVPRKVRAAAPVSTSFLGYDVV